MNVQQNKVCREQSEVSLSSVRFGEVGGDPMVGDSTGVVAVAWKLGGLYRVQLG